MKEWRTGVSALLLRLVAGAVFIPHGYSKVFGAGGPAAFSADLPSYHIPAFLGYLAAYAEFFGAILLIAGLLTRVDAFLLASTMFVAVFVVQLPDALRDPDVHGIAGVLRAIELPLSLLAITTAVLIIGPGRFSLDSLIFRRSQLSAVSSQENES